MHATINSGWLLHLSVFYDDRLPIVLSAALAHLIVCFLIQDLTDLTNPTISLSGSYVAQIMWDVFESRYGYGLPSLLLMLVPLGAICFCGMLSITSASRCLRNRGMNIMDCQGKDMCIDISMSYIVSLLIARNSIEHDVQTQLDTSSRDVSV